MRWRKTNRVNQTIQTIPMLCQVSKSLLNFCIYAYIARQYNAWAKLCSEVINTFFEFFIRISKCYLLAIPAIKKRLPAKRPCAMWNSPWYISQYHANSKRIVKLHNATFFCRLCKNSMAFQVSGRWNHRINLQAVVYNLDKKPALPLGIMLFKQAVFV